VPCLLHKPASFGLGWTIDSLAKRLPSAQILVRIRTDTPLYRNGTKYAIERTTLGAYCQRLHTKKGLSSYMAAQNIPRVFPQLEGEVSLPSIVAKKHNGPYLWIAPKGHYEFMHMDPDDNVLVVLEGCKRVRMLPPGPLQHRYPNPLGSKGKTIQSQVDLSLSREEIVAKYPLFPYQHMLDVVLKPGDMLFLPAFYWHQVTSLDASLSVNIFFGDSQRNNYINKLMRTHNKQAFYYWVLNIIEQNRNYANFNAILRLLEDSLTIFFQKQWHEKPEASQLEAICKHIRTHFGKRILDSSADVKSKSFDDAEVDSNAPPENFINTHVHSTNSKRPRDCKYCKDLEDWKDCQCCKSCVPGLTRRGRRPPVLKIRGLRWR